VRRGGCGKKGPMRAVERMKLLNYPLFSILSENYLVLVLHIFFQRKKM
jgi:hypothetical protein